MLSAVTRLRNYWIGGGGMNNTYWDDRVDGFQYDIDDVASKFSSENYLDKDFYEWEYLMYLRDRGE